MAARCSLLACAWMGTVAAQQDPGPRAGAASAGSPIDAQYLTYFNIFKTQFETVDVVPNNSAANNGNGGLGPRFNGNSCAMCHSQPATGGSSPSPASPQVPQTNPEITVATLDGAHNTIPSFITPDGPVREARFVRSTGMNGSGIPLPAGSPDGSVHTLFVISGRSDAPGCNIAQPDFAQQLAAGNLIFRIPTPLFGAGLVENTPDSVLLDNLQSNATQRRQLGIAGHFNAVGFNLSGNTGTIARFGWKAQNTLGMFAGEAYNVELGVTNDMFPNKRDMTTGCTFNSLPEDSEFYAYTSGGNPPMSDISQFIAFMRLLAPPTPTTATASEQNGAALFNNVGCALCHSTTLTTGTSSQSATLNNVTYHPFSDFALHHMGTGLSDGVSQGTAGPDEFRTAPLWGLGQRLFFLHDGRTSDLLQAIKAHASQGSEASGVITLFNALSSSQQQDMLNFLRSL